MTGEDEGVIGLATRMTMLASSVHADASIWCYSVGDAWTALVMSSLKTIDSSSTTSSLAGVVRIQPANPVRVWDTASSEASIRDSKPSTCVVCWPAMLCSRLCRDSVRRVHTQLRWQASGVVARYRDGARLVAREVAGCVRASSGHPVVEAQQTGGLLARSPASRVGRSRSSAGTGARWSNNTAIPPLPSTLC